MPRPNYVRIDRLERELGLPRTVTPDEWISSASMADLMASAFHDALRASFERQQASTPSHNRDTQPQPEYEPG